MNQVYNNPLIIRNVEFKEYLTDEEALKKINEFRFSDAGQTLPDNKKISLKRIANYFVTHPNFDEVSDDHVLIKEGYPIIFTSKNYKKLKHEKPTKREGLDNKNNQPLDGNDVGENSLTKRDPLRKSNTSKQKQRIRDILISKGIDPKPQTLVPDEDGKMKLVQIVATQESCVRKDNAKSNKLKTTAAKKKNQSNVINHKASDDHIGSNRVVISPPKKKKNKKSINEESNATGENDIQEIGLIQEINVEMVNIGPGEKSGAKNDEAARESGLTKDNSSMKKIRSDPIEEKKLENKVAIRTSKKRTSQERDKMNVKKVKVEPSNNSIADEESNDINSEVMSERRLIRDIDETGLIQGTAKVKGDSLKNKKKKKSKESNITNLKLEGRIKNDKKDSSKECGLKNNKSISSKETKETIGKDSNNTSSAVTINLKKKKKKKT